MRCSGSQFCECRDCEAVKHGYPYRPLIAGDMIRSTDQARRLDNGQWETVQNGLIGKRYSSLLFAPMRRRTTPAP